MDSVGKESRDAGDIPLQKRHVKFLVGGLPTLILDSTFFS